MSEQTVILTGHSMPDKFDDDLSAWMRSKVHFGSKNDGGKLSFVIVHLSCYVILTPIPCRFSINNNKDLPQSVGQ